MMPGRKAVFVIAEAGVNHNGEMPLALALCDAALAAGADAVKFQTFRADDLVVPGAPTAQYQARETGHVDQYAMLQALELSQAQHAAIQAHCTAIGLEFFSTPFSVDAVDMLVGLGVRRLKLSSGELTHKALVVHAAQTGLPLLLSTGMATLQEIEEAVGWVAQVRPLLDGVVLLHCTSAYPALDAALNLSAMAHMEAVTGLPVGYSDHSLGIEASMMAVALGAPVIEKHLTLDCTLPGPDHSASLEPHAFGQMVRGIRRFEAMRGNGIKEPHPDERDTASVARRSVVARTDIAPGCAITASMLACRRPATGIAPKDWDRVVGRKAGRGIRAGSVVCWDDLAPL